MNFCLTKNPIFFDGGGGFYKLTRNPNLTIFFRGWGGELYLHEQTFQIAILLFKENTCAKLF